MVESIILEVIPFAFLYAGIFFVVCYFLRNITIFKKKFWDYIWPIKFYILGSVLVVISQYMIAVPFGREYPFLANLTQILWELLVILSVVKLIRKYNFEIKNIAILGILYSIIIHGMKISIRFLFYDKGIDYIINRFTYGSILVVSVVVLGALAYDLLEESKNKKIDMKKIFWKILAVFLIAAIMIVSARIYNPV